MTWARKDRKKKLRVVLSCMYFLPVSLFLIEKVLSLYSFSYSIAEPWFCPLISRAPHFTYFLSTSGKPWKNSTGWKCSAFPIYFIRIHIYTCALILKYYLTSQFYPLSLELGLCSCYLFFFNCYSWLTILTSLILNGKHTKSETVVVERILCRLPKGIWDYAVDHRGAV